MSEIIDQYNRNNEKDQIKKEIYERKMSLIEKQKTKKIRKRISNYVEQIVSKERLVGLSPHPEFDIKSYKDVGYISLVTDEDGNTDIHYYGREEDEAFCSAIIDYELSINERIELRYRDLLKDDYCYRFLNDEKSDDDYPKKFYFAEFSLQDLKWCYGDNIPQEFLDFFVNYITEVIGPDFRYDIGENRIIRKDKHLVKKQKD